MRLPKSKILSRSGMPAELKNIRQAGKTVSFTNGCFDIIHSGHLEYLVFARRQADVLVVGVNSDDSVRRNKGPGRPIIPQDERAFILAGLECVDYVVIFDEDEPAELVAELVPDVLVKGKDWAHYVSGRETVEANGGKVVLANLVEGRSTTDIARRIADAGRK